VDRIEALAAHEAVRGDELRRDERRYLREQERIALDVRQDRAIGETLQARRPGVSKAADGVAVALHPSILRRLADRGLRAVGRDPLPDGALPSVRAIATAALLTATNQILNGAAMLIVLTTVTDAGPRDLLLATGALSLAGVAGILVVLAPAGLGVREGALIGLLATRFAVDAAALASVVVRAVMIVSDLALVLLALVIDVASGAGVIASVFRRERPRAVEPRSVPAAVVPQRRSA
jgi:hypothetical protein